MNKTRKCLSAALSAFILCSAVSCHALSAADLASVSQSEMARYIIIGGAFIALVGVLLLLLSFLKSGKKKFEDDIYDDYDDSISPFKPSDTLNDSSDDSHGDDSADTDNSDNEDEALNTTDASDTADNSDASDSADEDNDNDVQPQTDESESENAESEDSDNDAEEAPAPIEKVRLTLGGMNSDDVRIVEFSDKATIGRRNTNNVVISDNAVSGEHCRLTYSDGKVIIEDMDSTNGTVLNGTKITVSEIKNGDTIILGKTKYKISFSIIDE